MTHPGKGVFGTQLARMHGPARILQDEALTLFQSATLNDPNPAAPQMAESDSDAISPELHELIGHVRSITVSLKRCAPDATERAILVGELALAAEILSQRLDMLL